VAEDAVGAQEVGGPVEDEPVPTESIPRSVRVGIGVFLALFIFTGVFEIQAWPFTGWRLFSHTRTDESVALAAFAVDRAGHSTPLHGLRVAAFRDLSAVAAYFDGLSPSSKATTCQAWLSSVRRVVPSAVAVRIYRVTQELVPQFHGRPAAPPVKSLAFACPGTG
jgi:hypothetical protein